VNGFKNITGDELTRLFSSFDEDMKSINLDGRKLGEQEFGDYISTAIATKNVIAQKEKEAEEVKEEWKENELLKVEVKEKENKVLYADQGCGVGASNLGASFESVHECLAVALQTEGCGVSVMWSELYHYDWGCYCCTSDGANGGDTNSNWAVWTYGEETTTGGGGGLITVGDQDFDATEASVVMLYADQDCGVGASNLGASFESVHECLAVALQTEGCGVSVMWSELYHYDWGCYCCTSDGANGGDTNSNWAVWTYGEETTTGGVDAV